MGRRRIYRNDDVPLGTLRIVREICRDYSFRASRLRGVGAAKLDDGVAERYREINGVIDKAMNEADRAGRHLLYDFSRRIGYDQSKAQDMMSRGTYYKAKHKFILDIAEGLKLI